MNVVFAGSHSRYIGQRRLDLHCLDMLDAWGQFLYIKEGQRLGAKEMLLPYTHMAYSGCIGCIG